MKIEISKEDLDSVIKILKTQRKKLLWVIDNKEDIATEKKLVLKAKAKKLTDLILIFEKKEP